MAKSFSKILGIDSSMLTDLGAFDPILDLDTRLFIDPHLLKHCEVPEFEDSYENLQKYFLSIGRLLNASDAEADVFWNKADEMMVWPEVKGLCIGYSAKGTSGSGIGPELRKRLLQTAKIIIDKGKNDPEIFELVGMFVKNFGSDRISDMTANILRDDLGRFTSRIISDLDLDISKAFSVDSDTGLPLNPFTGNVIYFVPKALLRDLPVAFDWDSQDVIAAQNQALRAELNHLIGKSWREAVSNTSKDNLKKIIIEHPDLIDDLISIYTSKKARHYNFFEDRSGEYIWYPETQRATRENPIALSLPSNPTIDDVESLVIKICEKFKSLIEENGLSKLLYNADGSVKHESAAQLLFYGVAEAYCDANKIMLARESDSGRGPVDFKFGTSFENSVLVELKKSTNISGLIAGLEKQLPQYMRSEKSRRAIYLVLDVGFTKASRKSLEEARKRIVGASIKIFNVNGGKSESASKLR